MCEKITLTLYEKVTFFLGGNQNISIHLCNA